MKDRGLPRRQIKYMGKKYKKEDFINKTYGRLTVLHFVNPTERIIKTSGKIIKYATVHCLCTCGNTLDVILGSLKDGNTKSCGCLRKEISKQPSKSTKHGFSKRGQKLNEYDAWVSMKNRCYNPNIPQYKDYGGRGIVVCSEWFNNFPQFYKDIGERPTKNHSLDRINNDGNYEPNNCRWATWNEQANNRRSNVIITYKEQTKCLSDWAIELKINAKNLYDRLFSYKWTIERAFNTPVKFKNKSKHTTNN